MRRMGLVGGVMEDQFVYIPVRNIRAKTTQIRDVEGGRFPKSSGLVTPLCTE